MKLAEVRLHNLKRLMKGFGLEKEFAEAVGISPTYLSQIKNGTKAIGEELVERIEKALHLPPGEMDSRTSIAKEANVSAVAAIAHAIESLPPGVRGHLAALVFELARNNMLNEPVGTFDMVVPDDEVAGHAAQDPAVPTARRR